MTMADDFGNAEVRIPAKAEFVATVTVYPDGSFAVASMHADPRAKISPEQMSAALRVAASEYDESIDTSDIEEHFVDTRGDGLLFIQEAVREPQ